MVFDISTCFWYDLVPMFGYIGTISYLLLKRYSSSLAMIKPKILLTGATGKTGGAVVTELLAKGWPVPAAVRVRDARSDRLQRRGAEIVVVDIFDPNQLMDAMRGVQRAYYCPPYHPFVIQSASAFAVAARETGLEQIVGLLQWLAGPNHPALMTRQQWLIDRMFAALPNFAHTAVTPGFFADSPFLEMMPIAAHLGILPLPVAGESRNARPRLTISPALRSPRSWIQHAKRARATGRLGRSSSPLLKWRRSSAASSATKCGMSGHGSGSFTRQPRHKVNNLFCSAD